MLKKTTSKTLKWNKFLYLFFFLFSYLISFSAFSQEEGGGVPAMTDPIGSGEGGAAFVAAIMAFLVLIASIAGIVFIFQAIIKLFNYHKNPNDPKTSFKSIMWAFVAGALLTNINGSASILITSITGNDRGFCFNQAGSMSGDIKLTNIGGDSCFDADSSEITQTLRESLTAEGTEAWDSFKHRMGIFLGVIQLIGFYYFIKSIFLLKSSADGRDNTGIGKILVMMIFSSIAMDLENAVEIILNTISGFRGG